MQFPQQQNNFINIYYSINKLILSIFSLLEIASYNISFYII